MTDDRKTTVRISQAAARFLRPDIPREDRLKAARGEASLSAGEIPLVQFCLCRDADPEIRAAAEAGLRGLPESILLEAVSSPDAHPRLLELIARLHGGNPAVAGQISLNPATDENTLALLAGTGAETAGDKQEKKPAPLSEEEDADEDDDALAEEAERLRSNFQLAKEMSVSEKIKMALTGDKEWRMLLVKDNNKLISGSVIKNPRITEAEVLLISKSHLNNDDILRDICINKDWTKNYQIRKSLLENHKTPLHFALRFVSGLTEKDLAVLARSKNVSSVISTQARRLLMNKQKDK